MAKYQVTVGSQKYQVDAPDEQTAWEWANYTHEQTPPKPKERSWTEALVTDPAAGLVSGVGQLTQFPSQMYGLATGDFSDTGLMGVGKAIEAKGAEMKSEGLKEREALRDQKVAEAEARGKSVLGSQWNALKATMGESITDPALMSAFLFEQIPNQAPAILAAIFGPQVSAPVIAARQAAQKLGAGAAKEAAEKVARDAAIKAGTKAAVGTAAVQQGADVGAGTFEEVYVQQIKQGVSPDKAKDEALALARAAGASGAVISLLAQKLPGSQQFERILAGERTGVGRIMGGVTGALKEIPSEMVEEGGGRFTQNLALRENDPNQSLAAGLGKTAGMAALGAIGMGGTAGVLGGRGDTSLTAPPPASTPASTQQTQQTQPPAEEEDDKVAFTTGLSKAAEDEQGAAVPLPPERLNQKKIELRKVGEALVKAQTDLDSLTEGQRNGQTAKLRENKVAKLTEQFEALKNEINQSESAASGTELGDVPDTATTGVGTNVSVPTDSAGAAQGIAQTQSAGDIHNTADVSGVAGGAGQQSNTLIPSDVVPTTGVADTIRTNGPNTYVSLGTPVFGVDNVNVHMNEISFRTNKGNRVRVTFDPQKTRVSIDDAEGAPLKSLYQNYDEVKKAEGIHPLSDLSKFVPEPLANAINTAAEKLNTLGDAKADPTPFVYGVLRDAFGVDINETDNLTANQNKSIVRPRISATTVQPTTTTTVPTDGTQTTETKQAEAQGQKAPEPVGTVDTEATPKSPIEQEMDRVAGRIRSMELYVADPKNPAEERAKTSQAIVDENAKLDGLKAEHEANVAAQTTETEKSNQVIADLQARKEGKPTTALPTVEETSKLGKEEIQGDIAAIKDDYDATRNSDAAVNKDTTLELPQWSDLTIDQRQVYLDHITANPVKASERNKQRRNARAALRNYRDKVRDTQKTTSDLKAAPEIGHYERNRSVYNTQFQSDLPSWDRLTPEQQVEYKDELDRQTQGTKGKNGKPLSKLDRIKNASAEQHDAAFLKIHEEQIAKAKDKYDKSRDLESATYKEAQEEIAKKDAERKEEADRGQMRGRVLREVDKITTPYVASLNGKEITQEEGFIPDQLVRKVKESDMKSVMNWLVNSSPIRMHRVIAKLINGLGLKTTIRFVDSLPKDHVAEYDPIKDEIRVTSEGLKPSVILHELVHAASVNVLNKYLAGNTKGLTRVQMRAAKRLDELMKQTKKELSPEFEDAYKDLYEFVSNAITNRKFQNALRGITDLDTTTLPDAKSGLSEFVKNVLDLIGIGDYFYNKSKGSFKGTDALGEVMSVFEHIITVPEKIDGMKPLPSTAAATGVPTATQQPKTPPKGKAGTAKTTTVPPNATPQQTVAIMEEDQAIKAPDTLHAVLKSYANRAGMQKIITKFQNSRQAIKTWENNLARAGNDVLKYAGDKVNAIYSQIILSSGKAKDLYLDKVEPHVQAMHVAVNNYAKFVGVDSKKALEMLSSAFLTLHEPERRATKYLLTVPLSKKKDIKIDTSMAKAIGLSNTLTSAADLRDAVVKTLQEGTLNKASVKALRAELDTLVDPKSPNYRVDTLGYSPEGYKETDANDERYNVVGYDPSTIAKAKSEYFKTPEHERLIKDAMAALQKLNGVTTSLNKQANYWSKPVSNLVDFYGWDNYVPFKGKSNYVSDTDTEALLDYQNFKHGRDLQDNDVAFDGRITPPDNAILQVLSDATRSALRAGRSDMLLAIENAIKDGLISGDASKTISFEDRTDKEVIGKLKKGENIFKYNPNGSITLLKVNQIDQRHAIQRTYQDSQPLIDLLNKGTSAIGMMHTRYNPAFSVKNFLVDALTNTFNISAEMGGKRAAQYIGAVASTVATGGLAKVGRVAQMYEDGRFDDIRAWAKKDAYVNDIYTYIIEGGKVSYLNGISSKSQFDQIQKDIGSSNAKRAGAAINRVVDIWTDTFELASRAAAFATAKKEFVSKGMDEKEATVKAVSYAKELANFEQVGEWGRAAGAMFMFFRPAATGAVRAIDAIAPAFMSDERIEHLWKLQPKAAQDKAGAKEAFIKSYKDQRKQATVTSLGLLGMGAAVFMMSMGMADDDEEGRNKVAVDDMNLWTRNARFYIPGFEKPIQIPWGFGLGVFGSIGAQLAGLSAGNGKMQDVAGNTFYGLLDSFLPLPISRISPVEKPAQFMIDTLTPSLFRPMVEWGMNVDGLGREIYRSRPSRVSDAYSGGDNIPQLYKDMAEGLLNATDGEVSVAPNSMYFFASNYGDGMARMLHTIYNWGGALSGSQDFDYKHDTLIFSGFVGSPSNIDAREYADVEAKIKEFDSKISNYKKSNPDLYDRYTDNHPEAMELIHKFNSVSNKRLRKLNELANNARLDRELTPKERKAYLDDIKLEQNEIKAGIVADFREAGLEF